MNKNPLISATPGYSVRSRNQYAASWSRCLAASASLLIVSLSLCSAAQSVTLAWDASSDPSVAGYKLRYGTTSGNPSQSIDVGKTTTATISNLNDTTTYFFTATAYNSATPPIESQPSNEISYTTPGPSAGPRYVLTVNRGSGDGSYSVGDQVPVAADAPQSGEQFTRWIGDTVILAGQDPTRASTTATIPSTNVAITATYSAATTGSGLRGQYYNDGTSASYPLPNPFTSSPVLTRTDPTVDFSWGGNSPGFPVTGNNFSAKWTGQVKAPVSGSYTFAVTGDDGVRLFLNGTKVIEGWKDQGATTYTSQPTTLTAGTLYNIELHYYEAGGDSVCRLHWSYLGQPDQAIPQSQLYPSSQ